MNNFSPLESPIERKFERFVDSIKHLSHKDFDGHTDFIHMKPEQKLLWLSQAAQFYYQHSIEAASREWIKK